MLLTSHRGLGDTGDDSTGIDTSSFLGGGLLSVFVLGVGLIVAFNLFSSRESAPKGKKWAAGAWRNEDYEDWPEYERRKPIRKRRSKAA